MLDTKTIIMSRKLDYQEKIDYGFSLLSEFKKLEQEGHLKIINEDMSNNIGRLTVDTSFKGNGKKYKVKYSRAGSRKGNVFEFGLGEIDGHITIEDKNKVIYIEPDIFLKCELWKYTWNVDQQTNNWYAITKKGKEIIYMHRLIKSCLYGEESIKDKHIDHIEYDGLDNRLEQIRTVTPQDNSKNEDEVFGISKNKETNMYYIKHSLIGECHSYFKLFHIEFNMERPEPMENFLEFQKNVIEYKKGLDIANLKLEEHFQRHFKDNFNFILR